MAAPAPTPLAATATPLSAFNTLTMTLGTVYNIYVPRGGHAYFYLFNLGTGNVFIKGDGTVSATDPASYKLPTNQSLSPLTNSATGLWIVADAAGSVSIAVVPR